MHDGGMSEHPMAEEIKGAEAAEKLIRKKREIRERTAEGTLESMRAILNGSDEYGWTKVSPSPLYNAVALAAGSMGQTVVPYHRMYDIYEGNFTVEDIARLSRIPFRRVVFDEAH